MTEIEEIIQTLNVMQGEYAHIRRNDAEWEAVELAKAVLREKQEREQNAPLTLKELRGMDGEPVYIVDRWHCTAEKPIKHWVIWDSAMDGEEFETEFGKTVFAYRRPPEQ